MRAVLLLALAASAQAADINHGADLYRQHCQQCHGANGRPVLPGAPDFSRPTALLKPDTALLATLRSGRGGMPGFAGPLKDRDLLDIVAHLRTFR